MSGWYCLALIFRAFAILCRGQAAIVGARTDLRERVTRMDGTLRPLVEKRSRAA